VLDHVAVAVPGGGRAERRWRDDLGGGSVWAEDNGVFVARQLRYANGAKLELLSPSPADDSAGNFVRRFLGRFGSTVHHVTLKVPDLPATLATLDGAGLDVVDVNLDSDVWREGFLRPKQVGGLVVQVAWAPGTEEELARRAGHVQTPPAPGAAALLGPRLRHPDLAAARRLWTLLGAHVSDDRGARRCRWPDSVLDVAVVRGEPAGPVALRMTGTAPLPAQYGVGPAVEVPPARYAL
jgi:catechol 2,3-dioxygenase-like lactoylglutathione lyase family enzyme